MNTKFILFFLFIMKFSFCSAITLNEYYAINGVDFDGRTSDFKGGSPFGAGDRNCLPSSNEPFVDHEIIMRPKDVLRGVRIWVNDTNVNSNLHVYIYEACLPSFSAGNIALNIHLSESLETSVGNYSRFMFVNKSYRGRHDNCKMMARVRFGESPLNCTLAQDINLLKFRTQIRRNDLIFANGLEPP